MHVCARMQAGARMHDELYGHLLAALRLGAAEDGCRAAVCIAFEPAQPECALHPRTASFLVYRAHADTVHGSTCALPRGGIPPAPDVTGLPVRQ